MTPIAVTGAGIIGVTTAYALTTRGSRVAVLDRNRHAAMETSFANGGRLSASDAEVWNKLVTVMQGLRPMRPDTRPKVGRGRRAGVLSNTGHGHLGWTLSGATAERVAGAVAAEHAAEASGRRLAA